MGQIGGVGGERDRNQGLSRPSKTQLPPQPAHKTFRVGRSDLCSLLSLKYVPWLVIHIHPEQQSLQAPGWEHPAPSANIQARSLVEQLFNHFLVSKY